MSRYSDDDYDDDYLQGLTDFCRDCERRLRKPSSDGKRSSFQPCKYCQAKIDREKRSDRLWLIAEVVMIDSGTKCQLPPPIIDIIMNYGRSVWEEQLPPGTAAGCITEAAEMERESLRQEKQRIDDESRLRAEEELFRNTHGRSAIPQRQLQRRWFISGNLEEEFPPLGS
jgi:hypothetical protein